MVGLSRYYGLIGGATCGDGMLNTDSTLGLAEKRRHILQRQHD